MPHTAILCDGVWKSYRIYHQRSHTLKEKVLSRRNRYEEFWALQGVDLEVPAGTTVGIIGANGSGKSTLLKTMARVLTPDKGSVKVSGAVSPLLELGTGFHPELTGKENVFLGGSLLGRSRADLERRYDSIVEFAGIEAFMDTPVKNYSSGMYARLAFSLAISVDPEILILDEVLSVGDESFQLRCWERLGEFRAEGRTIVLVSHSLASIRNLCATAVWIDAGTVRDFGQAHDVVKAYLGEVHGQVDHAPQPEPARTGNTGNTGETGETGRSGETGDAVVAEEVVPSDAEITEVALIDASGAHSAAFTTGDSLTVRLSCRSRRRLTDLVCGVAVFRADNQAYVFGQNSREWGLTIDLEGEGYIEFTVPSLPLLEGSYVVSVSLHDTTLANMYDDHERRHSFTVFRNQTMPIDGGTVHVPSRWKASSTRVSV